MKFYVILFFCGVVSFVCGPFVMSYCMHEIYPLASTTVENETVIETATEVFLFLGVLASVAMLAGGFAVSAVSVVSMIEVMSKKGRK